MTFEQDDIVAVLEYGATARADADDYSDRDICVFVDDVDELTFERLRSFVGERLSLDPRSVACYRLSTVDEMVRGGSLFLWHLRLEGKVHYDPDGVAIEALGALAPYNHFQRDLRRFSDVFGDVEEEFRATSSLSVFEVHVLSVVVRNICMLLTVRAGRPTFGRRTVHAVARSLFPALPLSEDAWAVLMNGHLTFMRDFDCPGDSIRNCQASQDLLATVRAVIAFADAVLD